MAQSQVYQGAWQGQSYQGAWQVQAQEYSDTLTDSMTGADALIEAAGKALSDSMTGADVLSAVADKVIAIADTMTGADAIKEDAGVGISDVMTGADLLSGVFAGDVAVADSMTGVDALKEDATVPIQDVMTGADLLTGFVGGVIGLTDQMVGADQISVQDAGVVKADTMSGVDVLSGVLGPGILPGLARKVTTPVASRRKQPNQGTKLVTNRPTPLTSVTTSSTSTAFTDTSVEDSNAWDVSDVDVGDVVVVADEHMGFVTGTGLNTVNVEGWILRGVDRRGKAISKPDDAQSVTVHKRLEAGSVLLCALTTNTVTVYVGFDSEVSPTNGHPLSFRSGHINSSIVLHAPAGKILNLSDIWVIAGKDQYLRWQTDSEHFPNLEPQGSSEDVGSIPIADSMSGVDEITVIDVGIQLGDSMTGVDGIMALPLRDSMTGADLLISGAEKAFADTMTGADALIEAAGKALSDGMTPTEALTQVATKGIAESSSMSDNLSGVLTVAATFTPVPGGSARGGILDRAYIFVDYDPGTGYPFDGLGNTSGVSEYIGQQWSYHHHPAAPFVIGLRFRTLFKFDLSAIPIGAVISSARLRVRALLSYTPVGSGGFGYPDNNACLGIGNVVGYSISDFGVLDPSDYQIAIVQSLGIVFPKGATAPYEANIDITGAVSPGGIFAVRLQASDLEDWDWASYRPACYDDVGDPLLNWCVAEWGSGGAKAVDDAYLLDYSGIYLDLEYSV